MDASAPRPLTVSLHTTATVTVSTIPMPVASQLAALIKAHLGSGDAGRDDALDASLDRLAEDLRAVAAHVTR